MARALATLFLPDLTTKDQTRKRGNQVNYTLRVLIVRVLLLVFAALPIGNAGQALAAGLDDKSAGELQQAKRLYKSGRYAEAADIFSQLSAAHPDFPVFARNAGACYYYLRRPEPAISNLRDYLLSQKGLTVEDRGEVEGWISEMEKIRDQNAVPPAPVTAAPGPAGSPSPGTAQPADPGRLQNSGASPQGYGPTTAPPPTLGAAGYGYNQGYPPASGPGPAGIPAPSTVQPTNASQFPNTGIQPQGYGAQTPPQTATPGADGYGYGPGYPPAAAPGQQPYPNQPAYPSSYPAQAQSQSAPVASVEAGHQPPTINNNTAWMVGGLGAAVLVTGGVFSYLSQSAFSDTVKQYNSSKESSGKTYADIGAICYGVGAAGVVTAVIMMVMNEHRASSSVAFAPVVRPDAIGASIHYTY
jgi:hypothetical protein